MNYEKIYQKLNEESPKGLLAFLDSIAKIELKNSRSLDATSFTKKLESRALIGDSYGKLDKSIYTKKDFLSTCENIVFSNDNYKNLTRYLSKFKNPKMQLDYLIQFYLDSRHV